MIKLKNILIEADVFQDPNIDMDKVFMKGKDRNELTDEPNKEIEDAFKDLEKDIKSADLEPKKVDEALGLTLAGVALSMPAIIGVLGKFINLLKKIPGLKSLSGDRLIAAGDKYHHKVVAGLAKVLKLAGVKDSAKAKKFANVLFHIIIAMLLFTGGAAAYKFATKGNLIGATLKSALNAVKAGEIRSFILASAEAIG